ncbi:hypothetical protein M0R45_030473 [Rubus argutus]|uniref:Wall-associated receptor kinase galacturonan-binding domain-containing protein n=1 Tax=Rubus argutus TaxID=59490 RepID=A0AAW1WDS8_RUBAR
MSGGILLFAAYTTLLLILPPSFVGSQSSCALSCGNINIAAPFRLQGDLEGCGNKRYELSCEAKITVLYLYSGKYYVQAINYDNFTIRLMDAGVGDINYNFSNPLYTLAGPNFSYRDSYSYFDDYGDIGLLSVPIIFFSCVNTVNSPLFVETAPCINKTMHSNSYFIVPVPNTPGTVFPFRPATWADSCKITLMVLASVSITEKPTMSCDVLYDELVHGFELSWYNYGCGRCGKDEMCQRYQYKNNTETLSCLRVYTGPWYKRIQRKIERVLIINYVYYRDEFLLQLILSGMAYFGKMRIT